MGMEPVDPAETDRTHAASHDRRARGADPRTGRAVGNHGTAVQAIDYALGQTAGDVETFLRAWREGSLEEWPEFYAWLAASEPA